MTPFLSCLGGLEDPCDRRVRWTPKAACAAAILMALLACVSRSVACEEALQCLGGDSTRRRRVAGIPGAGVGRTYNGLLKALERQGPIVLPALKADLRRRTLGALRSIPTTGGWVLLAIDGSKIELPRTVSHEEAFGIADNGKFPQALVTAVVEVHTGLLWDWRIGRGDAAEKDHLVQMAGDLPGDSGGCSGCGDSGGGGCLLLGDGNFVGYPVWSALHQAGKSFLIRVGGNVSLLRRLWPDARVEHQGDIVYAWPIHQQHRCGPLRLRLIRVGKGKKAVHLLTNVLDGKRLGRRAAAKAYRLRWGVELFYHAFKRTMGCAKLKSHAGRRATLELEWGLIASWIATLMAIAAMKRRRVDPRRLSPAGLIRVLRTTLHRGISARPDHAAMRLERALAGALRDPYRRWAPKHSRHRPVTRNTPKSHQLKPPNLRHATTAERRRAQENHPALAA